MADIIKFILTHIYNFFYKLFTSSINLFIFLFIFFIICTNEIYTKFVGINFTNMINFYIFKIGYFVSHTVFFLYLKYYILDSKFFVYLYFYFKNLNTYSVFTLDFLNSLCFYDITFILGVLFISILTVWVRAVGPRFRLDQISKSVWKEILIFILLVVIIILCFFNHLCT